MSDCRHENVSTYRSVPSRSVCLDCMEEVVPVWISKNPDKP